MENRVTVGGFFSEAIPLGLKNALAIIINSLLFTLTCWIPYLNLGTMIGMVKIVIKIAKGESIEMVEIFDAENRKQIGDFFMTFGLVLVGSMAGANFVLLLAWSQSLFFTLDKGLSPLDAITASYKATYGNKLAMFFGFIILYFAIFIAIAILVGIFTVIRLAPIGGFLAFLAAVASSCIMVGALAYIYKKVSVNV